MLHLPHLLSQPPSMSLPCVARTTLPWMYSIVVAIAAGTAPLAVAQNTDRAAAAIASDPKLKPDACKQPGNENKLECLGGAVNLAMKQLVANGCSAGACGNPPGVNVERNLMRTLPAERIKLLEATALWMRMNGISQSDLQQLSKSLVLK